MYGLKNVRNRRSDALSRVSWDELECLLAIYYRGQGYGVDHVGTGGASARFDGGIDLKLHRGDEYIVVQCKHWNAKQVPHNEVHQLIGIMVTEGATGAILVTSGEFSAYARESASKHGRVELIDGDALRAMVGPLPEPTLSSTPVSDKAGAMVAHVGRRLLSAAEDRIRGNSGGHRRDGHVASTLGSVILLKTALPIALTCLVAFVAFGFIKRAINGLQAPHSAPVSQTAPIPAPTSDAHRNATVHSSRTGTNPCHEVIDWQSGTYIDHCMQGTPRQPPSAAEQRELKRKADEAMKVLEATTPEV